jgi:Tfp pilus assembly protein PilF
MRLIVGSLLMLTLAACQERRSSLPPPPQKPHADFLKSLKTSLPSHFSMEQLQKYIAENDLKMASRYVNICLRMAPTNPALHVVNGFVYEEMASRGDTSKLQLAGTAYRAAYGLDSSHWLYPYLLGMQRLRENSYKEAQKYLAESLVLRPEDPDILYALACSSYYAQDIPVAVSCIRKAVSLKNDPVFHRSAAIILSAGAQFDKAQASLEKYKKCVGSEGAPDVQKVCRRMEDWRCAHVEARKTNVKTPTKKPEALSQGDGSLSKTPTVSLDCCLLTIVEDSETQKGNNLLAPFGTPGGAVSPLQVTLGGSSRDGGFVTRQISRVTNSSAPPQSTNGSWTKTLNWSLTPAATGYALAIMNAISNTTEFVARPTVTTFVGRPALILNTDQYIGTAAGTSGPAQINVDAGVKVEVTPLALTPEGRVTLEITFTSTDFNGTPNFSSSIEKQLIAVTKAKTATTLHVFLGQTAMIASMQSNARIVDDSRVPFLGNIPFLQYFFSNVNTIDDRRSFLFLVTPRLEGSLKVARNMPIKSSIAKQLSSQELLGSQDYSAVYYILKHLERSPLFVNFQSGDLILPFWGYATSSLDDKLRQLNHFLYF